MRGLSPRLGATSREFRQMCSVATGSTTSVGMVRIIVVSLSVARCVGVDTEGAGDGLGSPTSGKVWVV